MKKHLLMLPDNFIPILIKKKIFIIISLYEKTLNLKNIKKLNEICTTYLLHENKNQKTALINFNNILNTTQNNIDIIIINITNRGLIYFVIITE